MILTDKSMYCRFYQSEKEK